MGGGMAAWLVTSTPNASNAEREVIMATGPAMVMVMVHDHGDRHRQFPPFSSQSPIIFPPFCIHSFELFRRTDLPAIFATLNCSQFHDHDEQHTTR